MCYQGGRDGRVGGSCFVSGCCACSETSLVRFTEGMDLLEAQKEENLWPWTLGATCRGTRPPNRERHSSFCVMFPLEKPFC